MTTEPIHDPAVQAILAQLPETTDAASLERMLPAGCYTDPAFFEFERRHVFSRSWICVGRVDDIPEPGDYLAPEVAGEPLLVTRTESGDVHAMTAVCRHRGQVITCEAGRAKRLRCPLHFWTYDLTGQLVGAPRMGDADRLQQLRENTRLPPVRCEIWHGFIFVNLDAEAAPLAPSLAKLEPFWAGYEDADLVSVPPRISDQPLPWNWKVHVENFTDAYHPEFVHKGTHDFAPSVLGDDGVAFTDMAPGDNAIVRSVPLREKDGGMMDAGWGAEAMFPPIESLSDSQRSRITFALLPPSMTLVFAPGAVAYTLLKPAGVTATYASNDRVTGGGWLLPRSTVNLPDFDERAAAVCAGGAKIWAQDVPVNLSMQRGKGSAFVPEGTYGPLETTLLQFNEWLLRSYRAAEAMQK